MSMNIPSLGILLTHTRILYNQLNIILYHYCTHLTHLSYNFYPPFVPYIHILVSISIYISLYNHILCHTSHTTFTPLYISYTYCPTSPHPYVIYVCLYCTVFQCTCSTSLYHMVPQPPHIATVRYACI